jgi:chromosomal replication initiator protein
VINALGNKRFVIGASNRVAASAATNLVSDARCAFNTLLIRGDGGTGKTHLLHHIEKLHSALHPNASRMFVNAGELMRWPEKDYEEKLIGVDLMMLDDIDLLTKHGAAVETLSHVIDAVSRHGGRVAMTTTLAPRDLAASGFSPRLVSRLFDAAGADLGRPSPDMRADIMRAEFEGWPDLAVRETLLDSVAPALPADGHVIVGAAKRLALRVHTTGVTPSQHETLKLLADNINMLPRIAVASIQQRTAAHFHIPNREMTSQRRSRDVARPRQISMYLCKQLTPKSLPAIGRLHGGRDHTTVIHALRTVERLRTTDAELDADIRVLERELTH